MTIAYFVSDHQNNIKIQKLNKKERYLELN
ncbi:MAG: hypothetical protein ACI9WL_001121 [Rubritalea sp.]|jgi:hypothetical protein